MEDSGKDRENAHWSASFGSQPLEPLPSSAPSRENKNGLFSLAEVEGRPQGGPSESAPASGAKGILRIAILTEGGLVLLATVLGYLLGHGPVRKIVWNFSDAALGAVVAWPLLGGMWLGVNYPWGPWVRLVWVLDELVIPLFRRCRIWELALISLLAGVGEEMLFRGVLQDAAGEWFEGEWGLGDTAGAWLAVGMVSLLFGLLHWVTPFYALLAGLIGVYLGWWRIYSRNLLGPMVAHAVYDFAALVYLTKIRRPQSPGSIG